MRRLSAALVALTLAVLLASAPVAADHTILLTSQHDTAGELSAGDTDPDNLRVVGSGAAASVDYRGTIVDEFEDSGVTEYDGGTADWVVSTGDSTNGSSSLESTTASPAYIASSEGEGLDRYYREDNGDLVVNVKLTPNSRGEVLYALDGADDGFMIRVEPRGIDSFEFTSGSRSSTSSVGRTSPGDPLRVGEALNTSVASGEWLTLRINDEGSFSEVTLEYLNGSFIAYSEFNMINNPGDGIGFNANATGVRFDYARVEGGAQQGTYVSTSHVVNNPDSGRANLTIPSGGEATVVWQGSNGGGWTNVGSATYTTSGERDIEFTDKTYSEYRARVTLGSQKSTALESEGVLTVSSHPVLDGSSSSPDGAVTAGTPTGFTIDVSDVDFPDGDTVTGELFLNGVSQGTDTRSTNGTLSVTGTVSAADTVNVTWVATDSTGASDSFTYEVFAPGRLKVYNESAPDTLVTEEVTATFFLEDANGTVITRNATDGDFPLNLSDTDVSFTVTLEAANYSSTTYTFDSLTVNRSVFMLPLSEPRALVRFILDDNSGSFTPPSSVTLYVERALERNGSTSFRVVGSDTFDATDSVVVELRDETRHRLRLTNDDGETRVPGHYTTRGDATETIVIGQLTILVPDENGSVFDAVLEPDTGANGVIRTAYRDTDDLEHTVDVSIYELGNTSNTIVVNDTTTATGTVISTYAIPSGEERDTTWVVEWSVTEPGGEAESGREIVGGAADLAGPFNLDPDVQEMIVWVVFAAVVGLAVLIDARRLAPVVATVFATGFTAVGFLTFPAPLLGFAAVATVLLVMSGGDS